MTRRNMHTTFRDCVRSVQCSTHLAPTIYGLPHQRLPHLYSICQLFSEDHNTTSLLRTYPNTTAGRKITWEKPQGLVKMIVLTLEPLLHEIYRDAASQSNSLNENPRWRWTVSNYKYLYRSWHTLKSVNSASFIKIYNADSCRQPTYSERFRWLDCL